MQTVMEEGTRACTLEALDLKSWLRREEVGHRLYRIASRGHTTDEENQWLFDVADMIDHGRIRQ